MKKGWIVLAAVVAIAAAAANAQQPWAQEPTGYKDAPWGTTYEAWKRLPVAQKIPYNADFTAGSDKPECIKRGKASYNNESVECSVGSLMAGMIVAETWYFAGPNGSRGLEWVSWSFDADAFGTFEKLLVTRFGAPHVTEDVPMQNGFGAQFQGRVLVWRGPNRTVRADRYGLGTTKYSKVEFKPTAMVEAEQAKDAKTIKDAAKF
jgi:hypothetical protein